MILLLDAHALLWWLAEDEQLSDQARRSIADPANDVVVSAASVWEIEVKRVAGRVEAPTELLEAIGEARLETVPITGSDALAAARQAVHHRDPFDRLVVAQAQRLDAIVVTRDRAFAAYTVGVLGA